MRGIGIVVALALAGCAYQGRQPTGGGAGLSAVTMGPAREGFVVPPGRGAPLSLALRSFVTGNEGWVEVPGARCRVTGGDILRVDVLTPVRIIVPDLGPDAPALRADCKSATAEGSDAVGQAFAWPAVGRPDPIQRIYRGGGWWWGFQRTGPLSYPDLAVAMHPVAAVPAR